MYATSGWSKVFALDAKTGKELWKFDPDVDRSWLVNVCCHAVNRGVAYWNGKVYVGPHTRPDLRFSDYLDNGNWETVVRDGALKSEGMAPFRAVLTAAQADAIRAYVISKAHDDGPAGSVPLPHQ
jgi:outer membrane protein assembly factor BamB